jgi:hypothetical protein
MVGRIRVNPDYVKISGPESLVNSFGAVYTNLISVHDKASAFRQDVNIEKVNEELVTYSMTMVNAIVPVENYSEVASFEVPLVIKNKKKGFKYTLNYDRVKINVIIPDNLNVSERSFSAFIDADEIEIENDAFIRKNSFEIIRFVYIDGDSSEVDERILSATPDTVEIIVTRE